MDRREILNKVAPCSLVCHTCLGYCDGVICNGSRELLKYLDGVKEFYESHMPDAAIGYAGFESALKGFAAGSCQGCRSPEHNGCSIAGCFILECVKAHGADFCGECGEFPCKKVRALFEDEVYDQWLSGNTYIKENGIDSFWERASRKPHYAAYRK